VPVPAHDANGPCGWTFGIRRGARRRPIFGATRASAREEGIMTLMRWDPFRELEQTASTFNRLFDRPLVTRPLRGALGEESLIGVDWAPLVDIEETAKEFLIKAELPDVKKEEVKVALEDGVLTIQGERKMEKEEKDRKVHRVERSYGKFLRSFTVPRDVDDKKVMAEFKDGVLLVHVPKAEVAKPRLIEVKVA
jgi:HSP20 family protein